MFSVEPVPTACRDIIRAMAAEEDHYDDDFEEDDAPPTPTSPPPGSPGSPLNRTPSQNFPWALVTIDDLDMGEQLAAGAMGAVYAGNYRMRPVAIKTLHDVSKNALSSVEAELLVHASLRGPRTVELIAANLVPPKCCIVMERCECSLFEKLHRRPDELSRRQSVSLALQVAEGMNFLHTRRPPVVHRDLKSHNVLLDSNGEAKLCDFGLVGTREVRVREQDPVLPTAHMPPPPPSHQMHLPCLRTRARSRRQARPTTWRPSSSCRSPLGTASTSLPSACF